MKNKKLFAILTLVCFMLTLMPVAAFAAVDPATTIADSTSVVYTEDTDVTVGTESATFGLANRNLNGDLVTTTVFVWVTKDGSNVPVNTAMVNNEGLGELVHKVTPAKSDEKVFTVTFRSAGTFKVHVSATEPEITESGRISAASEYNGAPNTVTVNQTNATVEQLRLKVTMGNDYNVYNATRGDAVNGSVKVNGYYLADGQIASSLNIKANNVDEQEITVELDKSSYVYTVAADGKYVKDADGNYVLADEDTPADATKYARSEKYSAQTGKTLKVETAGAIEVSKESVTTNALGQAKFTVSGSAEGTYKVYVTYGQFEVVIEVEVGATMANKIECTDEPTNPIDILNESLVNGIEDIEFTMYDVNGNELDPSVVNGENSGWYLAKTSTAKKENYGYVAIVSQPSASKLENKDLWFDGTTVCSNKVISVEGTYTFKVVLDNGNYATATIEVKEFTTPVKLVVEYPEAIELGATIAAPSELYWLDANNVEKSAKGKVTLAATGYAIANFDSVDGKLTAKTDEKYIGSEITITAVDERYNLVDTAVVSVANDAKELKFATKTAEVKVNNKIRVSVVDENGKTVALGNANDQQNASVAINYVILDKPADARVFVSTAEQNKVQTKGYFDMNLTSNVVGNVTVQAVLKYSYTDKATNANVVKYYTGTQIFAVGNGSVGDVVVMSIGSNEIVINDKKATIDAAPIVQNDRTYVPFRALAEAFGAEVAYDEATQAVTAELNGVTVVMTIGSATYTVNGAEKTMDVAPFINGSRTMVPVRFVAEAFGIKVIPTYDENGATADILFNL